MHLIQEIKNKKKKKIQMYNISYFIGKRHFDNAGSQNYLIFQPVSEYFQVCSGIIDKILGWKSKA